MNGEDGRRLRQVYDLLLERYGPQNWWPADTPLEMVLGAILVQSTAWANAAKALDAIKEADALHPATLAHLTEAEIGELVRSSGFYTVKARRVKAFVDHVVEKHDGDLDVMLAQDADTLRRELLTIHGIGQETADCILLYAAGKPTFVIDEYTRRIVGRLGIGPDPRAPYADLQHFFQESLPPDPEMFGEYHALLVALAKDVCRKRPDCARCTLAPICDFGGGAGLPDACGPITSAGRCWSSLQRRRSRGHSSRLWLLPRSH